MKYGIAKFKAAFDPMLAAFMDAKLRELRACARDGFILGMLSDAKRLLLHEGKRIRPYMAHLLYRACGGREEKTMLRLSAAFELFHLFALIQDDIIDQGETRHGLPTLHRTIASKLKIMRRLGARAHVAEGQAMLIGDLLMAWSVDFLHARAINASRLEAARGHFFRMIDEVILGQMIDVDLTTRATATRRLIEDKMRLKTASYTFVRPLLFGATLAGATRATQMFCTKFGLAVGLGFQIQDDLFDLTLSAAKLKKTVFSDLHERQHTLFTQYLFDHGTRAEKSELAKFMGGNLTERDRPRVQKLFESSGAIAHGTRRMNRYFDEAETLIKKSSFASTIQTELQEVVGMIRNRTS